MAYAQRFSSVCCTTQAASTTSTYVHSLGSQPREVSKQGAVPTTSPRMALVLPALTDCRWWFESLLVHSGVSSATRRKATGADHKKMFQRPAHYLPETILQQHVRERIFPDRKLRRRAPDTDVVGRGMGSPIPSHEEGAWTCEGPKVVE